MKNCIFPDDSKEVALDLMLRTLMHSNEFINSHKNWSAISRLIPGTSAKQCSQRWEELRTFGPGIGPAPFFSHTRSTNNNNTFFSSSRLRQVSRLLSSMVHSSDSTNSLANQSETLQSILLNNSELFRARSNQPSRSLQTIGSNDNSISCKSFQEKQGFAVFNKIRSKSTYSLNEQPGVLLKYRPSSSSRKDSPYNNMQSSTPHPDHLPFLQGHEFDIQISHSISKPILKQHDVVSPRQPNSTFSAAPQEFRLEDSHSASNKSFKNTTMIISKSLPIINSTQNDLHKPNQSLSLNVDVQDINIPDRHSHSHNDNLQENFVFPPTPGIESITIHVIDDVRNMKKDFICPVTLLLQEMSYFKEPLSNIENHWQEVDVSVHCDLEVFSWLMRYILFCSNSAKPLCIYTPPQLDTKRVLSILVSSEFLGMPKLVNTCLEYIYFNINTVVNAHSSTDYISHDSIEKLTSFFAVEDIESIEDPKDKIVSKLYSCKFDSLLDIDQWHLYPFSSIKHCLDCGNHYFPAFVELMPCTANSNRIKISNTGKFSYQHIIDSNWSVLSKRDFLKRSKCHPRVAYWTLWSLSKLLACHDCNQLFIANDINTCSYHPGDIILENDKSVFSCCLRDVLLFGSSSSQIGCKMKFHAAVPLTSIDSWKAIISTLILNFQPIPPNNYISFDNDLWMKELLSTASLDMALKHYDLFKREHKPDSIPQPSSGFVVSIFSKYNLGNKIPLRNKYIELREDVYKFNFERDKHNINNEIPRHSVKFLKKSRRKYLDSICGENEVSSELGDEESSDIESKSNTSTVSSLQPNKSLRNIPRTTSKTTDSLILSRLSSESWNLMKGRRWNIDIQRETELLRTLTLSCTLAKFSLSSNTNIKHNSPTQRFSAINMRLERTFKSNLTSKQLQKYQECSSGKIKLKSSIKP